MTRHLALATLLATALVGCELGAKTTVEAGAAQCLPVLAACATNADCCSYGCIGGACAANPNLGGACKTTDDCGYPMTCQGGACAAGGLCRAVSDVCDYDNNCCSGNCQGASYASSGTCQPNHAPVVDLGADGEIPYHRAYTLQASGTAGPSTRVYTVSDADGDTLLYGWTLLQKPVGSTAALTYQTVSATSFTPDLAGVYVVQLSVTDGYSTTQPQRLTTTDQVTLVAVNTAPLVTATASVPTASRNYTTVSLSGTASDPDGDPVTCSWKKTPPGGAAQVISGPAACAGTTTASFTPDVEGDWTLTLEATDGVNTSSASATVTCVNDAPVANAGPDRAGNIGPPAGTTPPVSATATFTDKNGDSVTWTWTVDAVPSTPTASLVTTASLVGADTATASFVPDVEGDYVLRVRATDPGGLFTEDTVTVTVGRYVADLGHAVSDAVYAKTAERIVMVGPDSVTSGSFIYLLNPATRTETTPVYLSGSATSVSTSPDATLVAAAGSLGFWWMTGGVADSSAFHSYTNPYSYGDVVVAGPRRVYLFSADAGTSTQQQIYAFDPGTSSSPVAVSGWGTRGSASPAAYPATDLFVRDPYVDWFTGGPWIKKYSVNSNGQASNSLTSLGAYQPATCAVPEIWAAQKGDAVFDACGNIFTNASPPAKLTTSLPISPATLDSAADGRVVAAASGATTVRRFDANYVAAETDALPLWGFDGNRNAATAAFAFLSSDGNTVYVIVRATSGATTKYGLVTFP